VSATLEGRLYEPPKVAAIRKDAAGEPRRHHRRTSVRRSHACWWRSKQYPLPGIR
jgi:hypothetical protein